MQCGGLDEVGQRAHRPAQQPDPVAHQPADDPPDGVHDARKPGAMLDGVVVPVRAGTVRGPLFAEVREGIEDGREQGQCDDHA